MHNISQRREQPGERLTEEEKAIHGHWADLNAAVLEQQPIIQNADIIVYDDPQPAPMIHQLQQVNPTAKLVWRNHIDTDRELMANPHTPQGEVASYILHELGVNKVDAAIMHPVEQFVHDELSDRTFFAPATTEPHDDLNRELSPDEIEAGFNFINAEIEEKNELLREVGRFEDIQPSMDPHKRRITLIARFDESKGMDKAMELGVQTRQKMRAFGIPEANLPEVVIVGNGSIDDPSGPKMYEKMLELRRTTYAAEADGIVIMRLKHNYTAMNALMHKSDVITQTSEAEGWETRVSDAIEHGVPVVVSNRGGIQQQVVEGESGFVLDFDKPDYDLGRGSDIIMDLLVDGQYYEAMRKSTLRQAETFNRREITTTANVTRFLRVFNHVLSGNPARADRTWMIRDLVAQEQAQALQTRRALGAMVL